MRSRLTLTVLAAVFAVSWPAVAALARDGDAPPRDRGGSAERADRPERGPRAGDRRDRRERSEPQARLIRALFADIELDEGQRGAVRDIVHGFRDRVEAWREEHRDELDEIQRRLLEARREKDRDATLEAFEDLLDVTDTRPEFDETLDLIREQLTEAQAETLDENYEAIRERVRGRFEREGVGGTAFRERRERERRDADRDQDNDRE